MIGRIYCWKALDKRAFTLLQKWVTGMPYRHVSGGMGQIYKPLGSLTEWQLEAYLCTTTTPIDDTSGARVFKINAPDAVVINAFVAAAEQFSGNDYGFLSLLNFLPRRFVELFGFDGRKIAPIRFGDICSEIWYVTIQNIAKAMSWNAVLDKTNEWSRNCFHAGDMVTLLTAFPLQFTEEKP